ncbi:hypothetical protein DdX_03620 [Ditylenchus destructor]|uniref:Uncharacterized protein n=1 Tax=Ditylenchus destructor TaxID=166010 RepID=A0AAD4RBG3_9BILA|nr:hypothetical protein DdX_03620 [Ditylenchus destructor]
MRGINRSGQPADHDKGEWEIGQGGGRQTPKRSLWPARRWDCFSKTGPSPAQDKDMRPCHLHPIMRKNLTFDTNVKYVASKKPKSIPSFVFNQDKDTDQKMGNCGWLAGFCVEMRVNGFVRVTLLSLINGLGRRNGRVGLSCEGCKQSRING